MKYYLKKLGNQELGSVGMHGRPQRGRYMLTSMNPNVLSMFPPLSTTQLNDSAVIAIIPFYLKKKVYCNYVYHNDKYHGSQANHPRNEYRIYLNKELEDGRLLFESGDIVIFRKDEIPDPDSENQEKQSVYFLDLLHDHHSAAYMFCDRVIESYPINGGYGIYDGTISEFETKVAEIKGASTLDVVIDPSVTNRIVSAPTLQMAQLFTPAMFRDFVLVGYSNQCAVTGTVIQWNTYNNLEAAHIRPKSHGGLYLPNNGIAMCRDMHWAFDKGFFTVSDDYRIKVHPEIKSDYLQAYHGKDLRLPTNPFFRPDCTNLHYHQENVYGLFKTTGRL